MAACTCANQVPIVDECDPPEPIVPACRIPKKVISAMVVAGAKKEKVEGENLCCLRIDGVDSEAWNLYERWASSLGEVDPMVAVRFAPPLRLRHTLVCPPNALAGDIQD
ncbi:hypothetical protein PHYPSEUDO_013884 [Phytophthora pseudosyringae]|uniref:Uncharacterized protein n=1 Tax=Phytophthora pseudosyringae TaxID=221518 RepID=A0A8T1W671_9STRA|nr:hypothetical protein PHYPSEUDO_013884 [Phytophthora pseudosyringae]